MICLDVKYLSHFCFIGIHSSSFTLLAIKYVHNILVLSFGDCLSNVW